MRSKFLTGICGLGLAFVLILGGCDNDSTTNPPTTPDPTGEFTAVTNIAGIASWKHTTEDMTLDSTVVPSDAPPTRLLSGASRMREAPARRWMVLP